MNRLAQTLLLTVLLTSSALAGTYYECLVMVGGTSGGYASLVTPDKATPPVTSYYYAERSDLSSGPWSNHYLRTSITNMFDVWFPFPTNWYPTGGDHTQHSFIVTGATNTLKRNAGFSGYPWTNEGSATFYRFSASSSSTGTNMIENPVFSWSSEWSYGGSSYAMWWAYPTMITNNWPNTMIGWVNAAGTNPSLVSYAYYTNAILFEYKDEHTNEMTIVKDVSNHVGNWVLWTSWVSSNTITLWTNACLFYSTNHNFTGNIACLPGTRYFSLGARRSVSTARYYNGRLADVALGTNTAFNSSVITSFWNDTCGKYGGTAK